MPYTDCHSPSYRKYHTEVIWYLVIAFLSPTSQNSSHRHIYTKPETNQMPQASRDNNFLSSHLPPPPPPPSTLHPPPLLHSSTTPQSSALSTAEHRQTTDPDTPRPSSLPDYHPYIQSLPYPTHPYRLHSSSVTTNSPMQYHSSLSHTLPGTRSDVHEERKPGTTSNGLVLPNLTKYY